jgi:hypothetical protein
MILSPPTGRCQRVVSMVGNEILSVRLPAAAHDKSLTMGRRYPDTLRATQRYVESMCWVSNFITPIGRCFLCLSLLAVAAMSCVPQCAAQDVPLISGGVGFFTETNGGNTTYVPAISPVLAAPVGQRFLIESRAFIDDSFFPKGSGNSGYTSSSFFGLTYLQLDYLATPHITVVGGYFLTPFGTYNERLSPIWISNFQSAPLITPLGTMGTESSLGGMLRGSALSTPKFSIDYAAYFSASSTVPQFQAERSAGGRMDIYFPEKRLEIGTSYGRLLQGTQKNFEGFHVWWEPANTWFRLRSEYAHGPHSQGYWIEADSRLTHWGGPESLLGRVEPVFRMQQTFRSSPDPSDGLPSVNTQQADFGLDYRLPHEVRINTSYSRQFSSSGDHNVWETGIVYRFLFPTWKGKQ